MVVLELEVEGLLCRVVVVLVGVLDSILDSGIGIDKKDLEQIFTRFYQSNEMDKQYYGGTGIGLEVVKSFIDLHMGTIEENSEKNKGTRKSP